MARLLYSATMSLDGFIAGRGGDMSWLTEHLGPDPLVDELIADIGALLVGAGTFRGDDPHRGTEAEGKAFGGGWQGPQFVLTHADLGDPGPDVTVVHDLAEGIREARSAAGERYVNVLGADVARQCLRAGELDEVLMLVAPVLLGDGVRMFTDQGGPPVRLEPLRVDQGPRSTALWFRVARCPGR